METPGSLGSEPPSPGNNHAVAARPTPLHTASASHTLLRTAGGADRTHKGTSESSFLSRDHQNQVPDLLSDACVHGYGHPLSLSRRPQCFRVI